MKTGKNSLIQYIITFIISFMVGIFAGKLAAPISESYALSDTQINTVSNNPAIIAEKDIAEKKELNDLAYANAGSSYAKTYTASANNSSAYANSGLYMPSIGFYSNVSGAAVSGNTVQVPTYGVAKYGNLLVGHNPGTFSAILGLNNGDTFYLYGQKYQVYSITIQNVSNDMRFVGQETTASLSNGSKGLVLMTCYGGMRTFNNGVTSAAQRFLVYAKAV